MTPQETNRRIAEHLGWRLEQYEGEDMGIPTGEIVLVWKTPQGMYVRSSPPDFTGSLDAMAQAEATLTPEFRYRYGELLAAEVRRPENEKFNEVDDEWALNGFGYFSLATLTASQRACAFLKVMGALSADGEEKQL